MTAWTVLDIDAKELSAYADKAAQATIDRAETEKIRKAVRLIGDIYWSRPQMNVRLQSEVGANNLTYNLWLEKYYSKFM